MTTRADPNCANSNNSFYNDTTLNVTIESPWPRILWYDFQKCTSYTGTDLPPANGTGETWISRRNAMCEVDNETWYRFIINISRNCEPQFKRVMKKLKPKIMVLVGRDVVSHLIAYGGAPPDMKLLGENPIFLEDYPNCTIHVLQDREDLIEKIGIAEARQRLNEQIAVLHETMTKEVT